MLRTLAATVAGLPSVLFANAAFAQTAGMPEEWQIGWQLPVTDIAERIQNLSFNLHVLAAAITLFVTGLLVYVCIKFSAKNNPTPQRFTHNTTVEVVWTVVPVLILVAMAYPSIKLLYDQEIVPESELTVKAIGNQWYWDYAYNIDGEEVIVESLMAGTGYSDFESMKAGMEADGYEPEEIPTRETWKLAATAPMVVPVDSKVRVLVTASDVMHAWTVPSFGVKVDAVPGRLNETWFEAREVGTYYGQCSELCGKDHSYMPIQVEVVAKEDFAARLEGIKEEYAARTGKSAVKVASAEVAE